MVIFFDNLYVARWVKISADDILKLISHFFFHRKQVLTFHANEPSKYFFLATNIKKKLKM